MRFPVQVVSRNELLRSGKELGTYQTQDALNEKLPLWQAQARGCRSFAVWVAIDAAGKEYEICRGVQ